MEEESGGNLQRMVQEVVGFDYSEPPSDAPKRRPRRCCTFARDPMCCGRK